MKESGGGVIPQARVQLMSTCLCDAFYDDVAQATVEILEWLGCEIDFPEGQTCCSQPAFNSGDWDSARKVMRHTREVFDGSIPIVVPSGSCTAMLHHGAALAFEGEEDSTTQEAWSKRSWELCDFIVNHLGIKKWPGKIDERISFHRSCHTRGSNSYESAMELLGSIEGITINPVGELEQCCGFGGTFSVSFPHISKEMGKLKNEHLLEHNPTVITTLDMACMMHFGGMLDKEGVQVKRLHVAQILRDALKSAGKIG